MSEEKVAVWFAFTVDTDKRETVFAGAAATEQEALQKAQERLPGIPALAICMRDNVSAEQIHNQCIQRLAELDIIGSLALLITQSIATVLMEVMIEGVVKPQSEECAWLLNTVRKNTRIHRLSSGDQDRLTRHFISCEKCRHIIFSMAAEMGFDFGLTPEQEAAANRAADESYERVVKGEKL